MHVLDIGFTYDTSDDMRPLMLVILTTPVHEDGEGVSPEGGTELIRLRLLSHEGMVTVIAVMMASQPRYMPDENGRLT